MSMPHTRRAAVDAVWKFFPRYPIEKIVLRSQVQIRIAPPVIGTVRIVAAANHI
jgi:hypothetical protein